MKRSDARKLQVERMRQEMSSPAQITDYLNYLRSHGAEGAMVAEEHEDNMRRLFLSDDGRKFLIFLEKGVQLSALPNGADSGALRELNAVRNFIADLRRIVGNG